MTKSKAKYIQSLSQKKLRDADGVFVAEGPKMLTELISDYPQGIRQVYALEEWMAANSNTGLEKVDMEVISLQELLRISFLSTPNQVLAICEKPAERPVRLTGNFTLMLDTIQDPGNLGTIVRCADWFGVQQIVCSRDCADAFGPKCVQSSMGSVIRVQIEYADLEAKLKNEGNVSAYAATLGGINLKGAVKQAEAVLLIGNESRGLKPELIKQAQYQITIPRIGRAESLNAAVATGILLSYLR